jgi:adenylosuccinate synthase
LIVGQDENEIGGTHRGIGGCYGDKPKGEKTEGFMER